MKRLTDQKTKQNTETAFDNIFRIHSWWL